MNIFGINIEIGTISVIAIIAFLAGTAIKQVVSKKGDRAILKEKVFIIHARKFFDAFEEELAFLVSDTKPVSSKHGTTYGVLSKALNKHRHAFEVFKLILPNRKQKKIEKAWKEYLYPSGYNPKADFPLIDYEGGDDYEKRRLALSKINALLNYTKLA